MFEEKDPNDIPQQMWKFRYQNKRGRWQVWAAVESFGEAKELAEYHSKGQPYEIMMDRQNFIILEDEFDLGDQMRLYGLNQTQLSKNVGIPLASINRILRTGKVPTSQGVALRWFFEALKLKND